MKRLDYFGHVDEKGVLKLFNRDGFSDDLMSFLNQDVKITIEIKNKRSNEQNRYFHGVVIPIVKSHLLDLGWKEARSFEWVKDYIKYHCLIQEYINHDTGEIIKSLGKTSGLTTNEFKDFISDIQMWAAEKLDLIIPDPGTQQNLNI